MAELLKNQIAIIGTGCTKFGENFNQSWADLALEAASEACLDANIELKEIEAAWLGSYRPGLAGERNIGSPLAEALGFLYKPITLVSNICATGLDTLRNAFFAVAAGMYDVVLAIGVEKMRDAGSRSLMLGNRTDGHPLVGKGRTAPGFFASCANRYFHEYGIGRETLAKVAVKNHHNGTLSPKAHLHREITVEDVLKSPWVAEPLSVLDSTMSSDGAAAAIITRADLAQNFRSDYILIKGIGLSVGTERNIFDPNFTFLNFKTTQLAAKAAYEMAGVKNPRQELDVAQVHDCFTITEIIDYEDLGFADAGKGWKLIEDGSTTLEGDLPVNTDGGLKSFGHPLGASGLRMIYETMQQLQEKAGPRQVRNARRGLAHCLGGPAALAGVVVLERTD
ncbi:acetyl-CoA acetyltransferase [Thermodesulfobacteriota bacterium]